MHAYTASDLRRLFQLPDSLVRSLSRAGLISASDRTGQAAYSFQDLLVLRTAAALRAAKIPAAKITVALDKIRTVLPPGTSLSALSLAPLGNRVAVRDGAVYWEAHSGQYALPLGMRGDVPAATVLRHAGASQLALQRSGQHFDRALQLEDSDLAAARKAYQACLQEHSEHLEACINLGRLLHLDGKLPEAEAVYRQARTADGVLSFNLAVLLEDLSRDTEAMASYREALALDPALHDAHFNLARLYERVGQPREALRHLLAYRRALPAGSQPTA